MSDLGNLLKRARIDQGITLDQLQETTKIRKTYLEAIEEGNYKILPGNFYVRAFIKSYAEAVGLDQEEVLRLYRNVIPSANLEQVEPTRRKTRAPSNAQKLSKFASATLMIAFPLLIIGVIWYFVVQSYDPKQPDDDTAPITEQVQSEKDGNQLDEHGLIVQSPSPTPTPTPIIPEVSFLKAEKIADRITDVYEVRNSTELKIEVKITGDLCWMEVKKDSVSGKSIEQLTMKSGDEPKNWEVPGSAYLNIGRANAVEVRVNGALLNMGDSPNPKKFQINLISSETH